ncbi:MAG: hypothetical protein DSY37_03995 [Hyperthermus sp.]|nr:MAG: hypothetical protein DSY37_03995 [Hyperthermus sp.]
MPSVKIVTHTDLDGVASAAIYARLLGTPPGRDAEIYMVEPYRLHKVLEDIAKNGGAERIAIMDLGPNRDTLGYTINAVKMLIELGARVEWYDHHRWDEAWIEELRGAGARVYVDTSTCAAGVVAYYASRELGRELDEFSKTLASSTCAADLWRWDDSMAPRLYRVAERYRGKRGDAWRRMMIEGFFEGRLWWPELDEALEEYLRMEFDGFSYAERNSLVRDYDGCRVVFALKKPGPPSPSIVGNSLLYRFNADIAVIVRRRGRGLSLRSIRVDVRRIAYVLGGGGHPRAAGAPLSMPLHYRIVSLVYPRIRLFYASKVIARALEALGGCR